RRNCNNRRRETAPRGAARPARALGLAQTSTRASVPRRGTERSADASIGRVVSRTRKRGRCRTSTAILPTYSASTARNTNSTPNKNVVIATDDAQPGTTSLSSHQPRIAYATERNAIVEDIRPIAIPMRSGTSENALTPCQPSVSILLRLYLLSPACRSAQSNCTLAVA